MGKIIHLVKQVVPRSYLDKLQRGKKGVKIRLFGYLSKSARLSALYYSLLSNDFIKEQHGVMCGVYAYHKSSGTMQGTRYLLRRNIHRLEKGLLMKPRQAFFAVNFITETLDCYEQAVMACQDLEGSSVNELVWAHDVLKEYFNIVASNPIVDQARNRFLKIPPFTIDGTRVPYKRDLRQLPPVNFDDILVLSHRRRSVRWYLQQPVPRILLDQAMMVASQAPSACNRQPFEFRIFDDPNLVQQVSALPGGASGFYQNIPVIVVVVGKLEAYFNEQDRHLIYVDSSLAVMAFMYALETLGLSSCGINWHGSGIKDKKMSRLLGLVPDERVIMLISVGYPDPDGKVAYSQKKDLDILRRYN